MNASTLSFTLSAALLFALGMFTGCESTDDGNTHVSSNTYYGVGFYDPWYYGDYHYDYDGVAPPPPGSPPDYGSRPVRPPPGNSPDRGLHPSHPIASPPQVSRPSARPMPSIPSTPRPMPRPAMRR